MFINHSKGGGLDYQRESRWVVPAFVAVLILGCFLRFFCLGKESVWLDEVLSLEFSRENLSRIVQRVASDVHPPLYFIILHFFLFFGMEEVVLRFPSFIFGFLSIPLIFLIGKELYGREEGFWSAFVLAFSPFHLFYSQEARMYSLFFFWVCLATYLLLRALREGRIYFWAGYSLAMGLSFYTHYFTLFILVAQNGYLFFHWWKNSFSRSLLISWLTSQLLILIIFAPWIPVLVSQYRSGLGDWIVRYFGRPGWNSLQDTVRVFGIGPGIFRLKVVNGVSYLFLLLAGIGLFRRSQPAKVNPPIFLGILLCLPIVTVFLASQLKPAYQVKYLIGVYPFYILLVASGITIFPWGKYRLVVALLLLGLVAWPLVSHYRETKYAPWRDAVRFVVMEYQTGDVVGFNAGYVDRIFRYYCNLNFPGKEVEFYRFPYVRELENDVPRLESEMESLKARYQRLWLFQSHHWDSDPYRMILKYLLTHAVLRGRHFRDPEVYLFQLR